MIAERPFSVRVLDRLASVEERHRRRDRFRLIWPLSAILILGVTWSIALFDAVITLRLLVEVISLVCAIGGLEQRLGTALLGPFAPLPLITSSLLFLAALGWVRSHQPDSAGTRR